MISEAEALYLINMIDDDGDIIDIEHDQQVGDAGGHAIYGHGNANKYIDHVMPVNCLIVSQCVQSEQEKAIYQYKHLRFGQICIVGKVASAQLNNSEHVAVHSYTLDDTTSSIQVKLSLYMDDNDMTFSQQQQQQQPQQQPYDINTYVRVYGKIECPHGAASKYVRAAKIIPLDNGDNELMYHMMECMNASMYYMLKETVSWTSDVSKKDIMQHLYPTNRPNSTELLALMFDRIALAQERSNQNSN
jgi:hypothetical protein